MIRRRMFLKGLAMAAAGMVFDPELGFWRPLKAMVVVPEQPTIMSVYGFNAAAKAMEFTKAVDPIVWSHGERSFRAEIPPEFAFVVGAHIEGPGVGHQTVFPATSKVPHEKALLDVMLPPTEPVVVPSKQDTVEFRGRELRLRADRVAARRRGGRA